MNSPRAPVVLVHGAANSSGVWKFWRERLQGRGYRTLAPDLRGHGQAPCPDLARVGMADYVEDIAGATVSLSTAPIVLGWSMGGLAALMYGLTHPVAAVIALGPSTPGPLLASPSTAPLAPSVFGPEVYGITDRRALTQPTMPDLDEEEVAVALASVGPESSLARQERQRGIFMDPQHMRGRVLIVAGERDDVIAPSACARTARFFGGDYLECPLASHWGLVLNRRALDTMVPDVLRWLDAPA